MSLSDDDLLNNASPQTRQRFEQAKARRKSRERSFQVVIPSASLHALEAKEHQAQQAWVRWEYSPEEWARLDRIDWRPRRRACFWGLVGVLPGGLGFFLVAVSGSAVAGVLAGAMAALPILLLFWLSHGTEAAQRHTARQQSAQPHRVTIAKQGMWEAGAYFPLDSLAAVKMTARPAVLHFHSFTVYTDTASADTASSYRRRVLVPRGREEEAERLVQRFRTEVIEAREHAWQRMLNPPEPD